jgi:hypothetical protein
VNHLIEYGEVAVAESVIASPVLQKPLFGADMSPTVGLG